MRVVSNNTFTYTLPPMAGLHFGLSTEDLSRTWQLNVLGNLADTPFDIRIDDVRAVSFPDPLHMPVISQVSVTPDDTYGDGQTALTVSATVTDPDGDLAGVTVGLAALNGSNRTVLSHSDSSYTVGYTIPRLPDGGVFNLQLTARDEPTTR